MLFANLKLFILCVLSRVVSNLELVRVSISWGVGPSIVTSKEVTIVVAGGLVQAIIPIEDTKRNDELLKELMATRGHVASKG